MGFWLLTVVVRQRARRACSRAFERPRRLVQFFWVFAGLMAVAAVLFGLIGRGYQARDYPQ
jgi:hypothetical protein